MAVRKATIKQQVEEFLPTILEPGEKEVAGANVIAGPSPWIALGVIGLIGQLFVKYYYVVVTDRRVLFVTMSRLSGRPTGLALADGRGTGSVVGSHRAGVWSWIKYRRPTGDQLRLNVHRIWRDEFDTLLRELPAAPESGATPPPSETPEIPPPPG